MSGFESTINVLLSLMLLLVMWGIYQLESIFKNTTAIMVYVSNIQEYKRVEEYKKNEELKQQTSEKTYGKYD